MNKESGLVTLEASILIPTLLMLIFLIILLASFLIDLWTAQIEVQRLSRNLYFELKNNDRVETLESIDITPAKNTCVFGLRKFITSHTESTLETKCDNLEIKKYLYHYFTALKFKNLDKIFSNWIYAGACIEIRPASILKTLAFTKSNNIQCSLEEL
jgi:hypothetical protein